MITLQQLFAKITLQEDADRGNPIIQTTGHMTHVGDWSIYGNPHHGIEHMEAMRDWFAGKQRDDHSVSLKADGGVSLVFGRKKDGRHFISYKSGKKHFHSLEEIDAAGVPWAEDGKKIFAKISEMKIKPGTAFQGDMLWVGRDELENGLARPNTIRYKATKHPMAIAVHSQYEVSPTGDLFKSSSTPDIKQLKHSEVYIPDLQLKAGSIKLGKKRETAVNKALANARKAMSPEVESYTRNISGNKEIHKFLQEYFNEAVATKGKRSIDDLRKYIDTALSNKITSKAYMDKSSQKKISSNAQTNEVKRRELRQRLHQHIIDNAEALSGLFKHHDHLAEAKHHMLDAVKEYQHKHGIVPTDSHEHEGLVSALGTPGYDETLAKLTREGESGFSAQNRERGVERFPEQYGLIKEEDGAMMTASSGGISGMGYNLGGPAPDDVAVPPLKNRMASKTAKPFRRKLMTKLLGKLNIGREAY